MPVHLARTSAPNRAIRTVTASYNMTSADEIVLVNPPDVNNAAVNINLPTVAAGARHPLITIKRIDPLQTTSVFVSSSQGIDGDDTNISLSPTDAFGIDSGEAVDLMWDPDANTWRVI